MSEYLYRVVPLTWPEHERTPAEHRVRSPFKQHQARVERDLAREIERLDGQDIALGIDVDERHIRQDGQLYSNARPRSPAIELWFTVGKDRLRFRSDRYLWWFDNLVAITRTLEALRAIDRWGVMQGRQYEGYKALPSSAGERLSTMEAARIVAEAAGTGSPSVLLASSANARDAVRHAAYRSHPDRNGGSVEAFQRVQAAKVVLSSHFGVAL